MNLRLLLIRHGQTAWNAEGRFQGQADIPLDETGLRQAESLARRLACVPVDAIYSSDLQRAWQTTSAIVAAHQSQTGCTPISEPRLREMSFGAWQGLTFAEIQARDPQRLADWLRDRVHIAPPGGGETLMQLARRVQTALDGLSARHLEGTILLVGHGGPIQVLICQALGLLPSAFWQFKLDNASISEILLVSDGGKANAGNAILNRLNDTAHLGDYP